MFDFWIYVVKTTGKQNKEAKGVKHGSNKITNIDAFIKIESE